MVTGPSGPDHDEAAMARDRGEAMHPVIVQAVATGLIKDIQAHADAAGRAQQIRRSRRAQQARPRWPFTRIPRARRGPESRPARRPRHDPRAA
jgi:hypothetical protein